MQRLLIFYGCPVRNANVGGRHHVKKHKTGPQKDFKLNASKWRPKVSNGNKKGRQNRSKTEFQSMSVLMLFFGQAWLEWSRTGPTQMASFWGVCEGTKGDNSFSRMVGVFPGKLGFFPDGIL